MAELLLDLKEVTENEIISVKAWKVPKSKAYPEGINYTMAFIRDGKRVLGYDNNTFEGHHKHTKHQQEGGLFGVPPFFSV